MGRMVASQATGRRPGGGLCTPASSPVARDVPSPRSACRGDVCPVRASQCPRPVPPPASHRSDPHRQSQVSWTHNQQECDTGHPAEDCHWNRCCVTATETRRRPCLGPGGGGEEPPPGRGPRTRVSCGGGGGPSRAACGVGGGRESRRKALTDLRVRGAGAGDQGGGLTPGRPWAATPCQRAGTCLPVVTEGLVLPRLHLRVRVQVFLLFHWREGREGVMHSHTGHAAITAPTPRPRQQASHSRARPAGVAAHRPTALQGPLIGKESFPGLPLQDPSSRTPRTLTKRADRLLGTRRLHRRDRGPPAAPQCGVWTSVSPKGIAGKGSFRTWGGPRLTATGRVPKGGAGSP